MSLFLLGFKKNEWISFHAKSELVRRTSSSILAPLFFIQSRLRKLLWKTFRLWDF